MSFVKNITVNLALFFLFHNITIVYAQYTFPTNNQKLIDGFRALKSRNFEKAIKIANDFIENNSSGSLAYYMKAEALSSLSIDSENKKKTIDNALFCYDKAIRLDSGQYLYYIGKASLLMSEQKFLETIPIYTNALNNINRKTANMFFREVEQDKLKILTNRAFAYFKTHQFIKAENDYLDALKLNKSSISLISGLFETYKAQKKYEKANNLVEKQLSEDPNNTSYLQQLGVLRLEQKKFTESLGIFSSLISMSQHDPHFYLDRAMVYLEMHNPEKALKDCKKSIELYSENPIAYKLIGSAYIQLNKLDLACSNLLKANELGYSKLHDNKVNLLLNKYCQ